MPFRGGGGVGGEGGVQLFFTKRRKPLSQ